jgi:hypothetical protein
VSTCTVRFTLCVNCHIFALITSHISAEAWLYLESSSDV